VMETPHPERRALLMYHAGVQREFLPSRKSEVKSHGSRKVLFLRVLF
jgi:hypothetical protein